MISGRVRSKVLHLQPGSRGLEPPDKDQRAGTKERRPIGEEHRLRGHGFNTQTRFNLLGMLRSRIKTRRRDFQQENMLVLSVCSIPADCSLRRPTCTRQPV